MNILGIGDVTHDTSVCLMKDNQEIFAIEEERLTRIKHNMVLDPNKYTIEEQGQHFNGEIEKFTLAVREEKYMRSINYCLDAANMDFSQIDNIVISSLYNDLPFRHKACFINHHLAHAASAFYPSPFANAAILVLDGYGTYTDGKSECMMFAQGNNNRIQVFDTVVGYSDFTEAEKISRLKDTHIIFKNSLGVFYQNITILIGLGHFGEGKTMGLASYGEDRPELNIIREYIQLCSDGQISIDNRSIFNLCKNMIADAKVSCNSGQLFKLYADLAFKHQQLLEEMIIHSCKYLYRVTGEKNICLAGGVALNGVANYKILSSTPFEKIFVQPAAGDNGISIGCAMHGMYKLAGHPRSTEKRKLFSPYLGKVYKPQEIELAINSFSLNLDEQELEENACFLAAKLISEGKIVAWFNGASEIGPRALGNRSILADPRRSEIRDVINYYVKRREGFRPFAPAVIAEYCQEYFELANNSPHMLLVAPVKKGKRFTIPAVTHVDGSARVQTVHRELNPIFFELIQHFYRLTGVPLLLNTSFNGKGEPIVETPEDAIRCFLENNIDYLFLNGRIFSKAEELALDFPVNQGIVSYRNSYTASNKMC
ncbi:MAG TPA: carbamoyltransferase C-terminal domain-containing protein [Gammaproteobacteria bacterium]|nr:carbamoyltransferase C-terminal domain-containing protein [Gammaproteobacteria bacterium]